MDKETLTTTTKAEQLLGQTVTAHGGDGYDSAYYEFTFRKKVYTFKNNDEDYRYTCTYTRDGQLIEDVLSNDGFSKHRDGSQINLTELQMQKYGSGLNSVIYFATLPHKLLDEAVNLAYQGKTVVNGIDYEVLKVTFDEEGGGKDHDDEFRYWINSKSKLIDFLAYNYTVNGGGTRFRTAYNTRRIEGVIFQDYVNYKAPVGTPLADLPKLYVHDELKKLSVIETEKVISL